MKSYSKLREATKQNAKTYDVVHAIYAKMNYTIDKMIPALGAEKKAKLKQAILERDKAQWVSLDFVLGLLGEQEKELRENLESNKSNYESLQDVIEANMGNYDDVAFASARYAKFKLLKAILGENKK